MRNRLLTGFAYAAMTLMTAAPAAAQIEVQRHPDASWTGSRNDAYDEGQRAGSGEGERDGRDGTEYGFKRDDAYEDADGGYRGRGNKDAYRADFRRGYEIGYDQGYRRFGFSMRIQGGGSSNEYGPYGYPERGYGAYAEWGYRNNNGSSLRGAFDIGRREGYEAGFDAARDGRSDWRDHRDYRSTRGYDRRFGARDAYDLNYRNGFRAGYEQGYREGHRRRW